ncbi:MAG: asparagine synthase-related protein [Coxiellaceae bacterium]|nr:asparagine synthase-related protein [Coxiellaceae bacterium]
MIGGIFYRHAQNNNTITEQPLISALNQFNTAEFNGGFNNQHIVMANCLRANTPQSKNTQMPFIHTETGCVIVAWARLDYRDAVVDKLNANKTGLINRADNELIMAAYLRWGDDCCQHLFGDYCFAIYDPRDQSVFCGRDHMGAKPFYYYCDDNIFAFASSLTIFHDMPCVPMQPDESWMAHYMIHDSMDFEKTAYKNIVKLKPAHCMRVTQRSIKQQSYFQFNAYKTDAYQSIDDAVDHYREKFIAAVTSRMPSDYPLACELSGGIDSSSITAVAANEFQQPLDNFYTFAHVYLDQEPEYIYPLCQRYMLPNNFACCGIESPATKTAHDHRTLLALGSPIEHGEGRGRFMDYAMAQKFNVRTLFSGFGGDEFVTSIHPDIAQYQLLREKKYRHLYNNLYGNTLTRLLRLIKMPYKYLQHQRPYNPRFYNAFKKYWQYSALSDSAIDKYNLEQAHFDRAKFDHGYNHLNEFTLQGRWVPFVSTRMENCTLTANSFGIDYNWPLLDVKLIECFLAIPVHYKQPKGVYRYIHRKASEHLVPEHIIWKKNKDMGERVNQPDFKASEHQLNNPIHPLLAPMVNIDKLKNQIEQLSLNKNPSITERMQVNKNFSAINNLNNWLNYYHGDKAKDTITDEINEKIPETIA